MSQQDDALTELAEQRLRDLADDSALTTLDAVIQRLFDRDPRELLTVSAFGSAL